ncbi:MAG: type I-B CRISPR-associated protein Cas7/Cst2/DevR [Candidatus Aminicenantes bacterium]|nr:MAG: type I-B CRISPR-associated protein Cas7/Cst2/DevR [Candidatus Aminicenantes bacterium]
MKPNSITITYLSKVTLSSLNGGDKDVDNINPIKKVTLDNGEELPYVSSQALRHALREKLEEFGFPISPVQKASTEKGAVKTSLDPAQYIDDDLFGFMDAAPGKEGGKGTHNTRTSPIRVESLVSLSTYKGDLDYGTNFMGKKIDVDPNIFETEIHSGLYRGTILIELDRIGRGEGFSQSELDIKVRKQRVKGFIDAFMSLWSPGRQTRFLADISPKFIAAAYMKSKNPIFLEAVSVTPEGNVDMTRLNSVISDYDKFIEKWIFAVQESVFEKSDGVKSLKEGFKEIESWIDDYFK